MLGVTDSYPEDLSNTISIIQGSLPTPTPLPSIEAILESQVEVSTNMASHLESLASHYDQMAGALRESEAGELFSEEDLHGRLWVLSESGVYVNNSLLLKI
jgi:autophagy-related protein 17